MEISDLSPSSLSSVSEKFIPGSNTSSTPTSLPLSCTPCNGTLGMKIGEILSSIEERDPLHDTFMQSSAFRALPWLLLRPS